MGVRRHAHEQDRLDSLQSYELLDSTPTEEFAALTRLAAALCQAPFAAINLIGADRFWTLSTHGMPSAAGPRDESICSDVVTSGAVLALPDLTTEAKYAALATVADGPGMRAYAGVPLVGRDGLPLGALCVVDTVTRDFTEEQLGFLDDLARQVVTAMELRRCDVTNGRVSPLLVPEAAEPTVLRRALDDNEFVPYFQPVVDLRTGRILSLEALIRWQHPTRGLLCPEAFLAGLEHSTLLTWTARDTFERACLLMVDLREHGAALPGGVAINVSGRQLNAPGLAERCLARLARHALPGCALTLEITETAELTDLPLVRRELLLLREAGVGIVADDFGVGWSNLVRLLQLPLSGLKIDREIVGELVGDPVREQMVASALDLASSMGLEVVAEGVETEAVRQRLLELGCRHGQGWLFSQAVAADAVPGLLSNASISPPVALPAQRAVARASAVS